MAYSTKYELLCTGLNGIQSKAVIEEDGYTGSQIDRNIPVNPFRLRKEAGKVICGTIFEFSMRELIDFEYLSFYTNQPKKFRVTFYYPDSTLIWSGYINPQQYNTEYKPAPLTVSFQASDGLGLLKSEIYSLTGLQSELAIIIHCLDKIGLGLDIAIAINEWEIGMDYSLSCLEQAYLSSETFAEKDCYTVLEKILERYDAVITQSGNRWLIESYKDKKTDRLIYTSSGSYSSTESAVTDLVLAMPGAGDVKTVGILQHTLRSGGRKVSVLCDYGYKKSLLDNYKFKYYSSAMFDFWTKSGSFDVLQYKKDADFCAFLAGYCDNDTDYIEQSVSVKNVAGDTFIFEIDFAAIGYFASILSPVLYTPIDIEVRLLVSVQVATVNWFLTENGWSETPTYITRTVTSQTHIPVWTNIKIAAPELPGDGDLYVRLMRLRVDSPPAGNVYTAVVFKDPSPYFLHQGVTFPEKYEDTAYFPESTEPAALDDLDLIAADAPAVGNNNRLYTNIVRLADETPTLNWNFAEEGASHSLIDSLLLQLASRNRVPRWELRGSIKGASLSFEALISHAFPGKRFEISEGSWDIYSGQWDVTLLEYLDFVPSAIDFESGYSVPPGNLIVTAIISEGFTALSGASFNATYTVENTGSVPESGVVQWKITKDGTTVLTGSDSVPEIGDGGWDDFTSVITAPSSAGEYLIWFKMSGETSWTLNTTLSIASQIVISSIDEIPDVANGQIFRVLYHYNNATAGTLYKTLNWKVLDAEGGTLTSGSSYMPFLSGEIYSSIDILIPATAQGGLTLALSITGESPDPVISNAFASVSVTLNHIDTISNVAIGNNLGFSFEVTAGASCRLDFYCYVRTSTHEQMLTITSAEIVASGTSTLSNNIAIPNSGSYIMPGADLQIVKWGGAGAVVSNHFNITA
jgi:hypothetical protein